MSGCSWALADLRLIPAHDGNPATIPKPAGVQARLLDLLDMGYSQDKHENHSGPASPCVEALARPRRRVWPPEGLPVL